MCIRDSTANPTERVQRSSLHCVTSRFTLSGPDVKITKGFGLPSLRTRSAHTDLIFFQRVLLGLSGLPVTFVLKVPTYTLRARFKFIGPMNMQVRVVQYC